MDKICPLLTMTIMATPMGVKVLADAESKGVDCMKGECAWWTWTDFEIEGKPNKIGMCAISKIADMPMQGGTVR